MDFPQLLTVEEVAEYFKVTPRFVRGLISKGEIKSVRVGAKNVRVTREAVIDFIEKKTVAPPKTVVDDSKYSSLKLAVKRSRSLKSKDETVKGDYSDRLSQELKDQWR